MISSIQIYYFILLFCVAILTFWFLLRTLKLFKRKRLWAGCRNSTYVLLFSFTLLSLGLIGANVITYHRLTYEQPVALIHVKQQARQQFQVDFLHWHNCKKQSFLLKGDEWQIDARIIKWHGWANLLGLDAVYQLDRITGRFLDIGQQRQQLPSVYPLESRASYDLWALKKKYQWLPWLDAKYGQSVYLAMKNNHSYQVLMTQSGMIARENSQAFANTECSVTSL